MLERGKIDAAVDFSRRCEMGAPLYSEDNGRPSVEPVVLLKMVLIQHLYGLHMRQKPGCRLMRSRVSRQAEHTSVYLSHSK